MDATIIGIDNNSSPDSKYYGRLIKWNYNPSKKEWSYGIGLSDQNIFDTSENLRIVATNSPIFFVNLYRQKFSQYEIIERLKYALMLIAESRIIFNNKEWNDEHFARFIATNNAISYKVSKKFRNNKKYQKIINDYIKQSNPDLYINTYNLFVPKVWHRGRFWVLIFLTILYCILISASFSQPLILVILLIVLTIIHLLSEYEWSGFQNKQLWNWLELLIIPVLLAFGGFIIQNQATQRQKNSEINLIRRQSIKEYFETIQKIVKSSNQKKALENKDKKIIEQFTQLIFSEIDGEQKRQVVKFLYGFELIKCDQNNNGEYLINCENAINIAEVDLTKANLKNLDLSYVFLKGANLKDADLTNSNLSFADFNDAILENANFKLAKLYNTNFSMALFGNHISDQQTGEKWREVNRIRSLYFLQTENNLIEKIFSYFKPPALPNPPENINIEDFENQDFSQANLEKLDFRWANFKNADLSEASLMGSNLYHADLTGANLTNINLEGAYLKDILIDKNSKKMLKDKYKLIIDLFENNRNNRNISKKDLSYSNLAEIELNNRILKDVNLLSTQLTNSKLTKIDLSSSYLFETNLSRSKLTEVNLNEATLSSAILNNTILTNVDLSNSSLFAASLKEAIIKGNSKLNNADLNSADLSGADLGNSDLNKADLSGADLSGANLKESKNLNKAKLKGAIYNNQTIFPKYFDPEKVKMIINIE